MKFRSHLWSARCRFLHPYFDQFDVRWHPVGRSLILHR